MFTPMEYNDEIYKEVTQDMVPNVVPGKYLISNYGTVIDTIRNCQIEQQIVCGYLRVSLQTIIPNVKIGVLVHRLTAIAFCEGDNSLQVDHVNGHKFDHYYKNLEFATSKENLERALDMGLNYRCEDKPNATFTNEQVEQICSLMEQNKSYQEIIKTLNLDDSRIMKSRLHDIKRGRCYRTISEKYNLSTRYVVPNCRLLSSSKARKVCKALEDNPNISNDELFAIVHVDISSPEKYERMCKCIDSIKNKTAYTHISCNFNI